MSGPDIDAVLPEDDLNALAGEYVLGTLSAAARARVQARLADEPALRAAVLAWEARLLPLTALAEPVEPSPVLWTRIAGSVDAAAAATSTAPEPIPTPTPKPGQRGKASTLGWWHSLGLWRGLAATGFAAAMAMAVVLVERPDAPAGPQYLVVLVAPQDKSPGWVVQTRSDQKVKLIPLGPFEVPSGKSLQFWTKADEWRGPVSLGLVQPGQSLVVPLDRLPPLQPNQLFELTLEPANGSPLDRPTGPIQFIGRAVQVM